MTSNSNLSIGVIASTAVGTVAGAFAGNKKGIEKANEFIKELKHVKIKKFVQIGTDAFQKASSEYVDNAIERSIETIQGTYKNNTQCIEAFNKIAKKAKADYSNVMVQAGNIKNKQVTALAAAGAAIGLTVGLVIKAIVNKIKANKAQKAE